MADGFRARFVTRSVQARGSPTSGAIEVEENKLKTDIPTTTLVQAWKIGAKLTHW